MAIRLYCKVFAFDSKAHGHQIKDKVNIWVNWLFIFLNWGTIIHNNCLSGLQETYCRWVVFGGFNLKISYSCISSWDRSSNYSISSEMHTINQNQQWLYYWTHCLTLMSSGGCWSWSSTLLSPSLFVFHFLLFFSNRVGPKRLEGIDIFHWM